MLTLNLITFDWGRSALFMSLYAGVLILVTPLASGPWVKNIHFENVLKIMSNRLCFPFYNSSRLCVFNLRSSRERSSHTRERECLPSDEGWREEKAEDRDWLDREASPPADRAKERERERSLSFERDRRSRSSSEERESGEIWARSLGLVWGDGRLFCTSHWFEYIV